MTALLARPETQAHPDSPARRPWAAIPPAEQVPTTGAAEERLTVLDGGSYRIVLRGGGPFDRLPLEVERARDVDEPWEDIRARVEAAARADLRVTAEVSVLDFGALPRTEGKTRRVVRMSEEEA